MLCQFRGYGYGYGVTARKLLRPRAHFEQPRAIPSAEDNRALMTGTVARADKVKFGPGYQELIGAETDSPTTETPTETEAPTDATEPENYSSYG